METLPVVAITMGDPCGIGPEIILKGLRDLTESGRMSFSPLLVGCPEVFAEMAGLLGLEFRFRPFEGAEEAVRCRYDADGVLPVLKAGGFGRVETRFGRGDAVSGRAALEAIEAAARLAVSGACHAVATAPVSKQALREAGCERPGHAEIFAAASSVDFVSTMLIHGGFRVVHLSTHVSLREACDLVRKERIVKVGLMTDRALRDMGTSSQRIAVAALNPHGGDGGLFGDEESNEIAPAVEELKRSNVEAVGPVPADIVFAQALGGMWDAVLAMYHDQGHIPIKTASFRYDRGRDRWTDTGGATLTLGLPFPRTSVDHGTAYDIAGRSKAGCGAMKAAIELAAAMAARLKC